jgi:fructose-1,6-bisphosphatase/inositol monophosphatase family enzyme
VEVALLVEGTSMTDDVSHAASLAASGVGIPGGLQGFATSAVDSMKLLLAAEHAVDIGAATLRQGRSHVGALISKGDRDFATDVDMRIQAEIRAGLAGATPGIQFLGEEGSGEGDVQGAWWVLDPIDGTINFARDSPLCSISLSLVIDGQPVLGIVDAPLLGERFIARQGNGAYLNGARIRVCEVPELREAIVGSPTSRSVSALRRRTVCISRRLGGWPARACACGCLVLQPWI